MEIPAFYIFTNNVYEKYKTRIGKNPYKYLIKNEEFIDIDTEDDFENAVKIMLDKNNTEENTEL